MNMQEDELRQLLESHGWDLLTRERTGKKRTSVYLYARKWPKVDVYIATRRYLPAISRQEVLEKIGAAS